jgi:alpha-1,3-rhamnosyl/mannosyltransferase
LPAHPEIAPVRFYGRGQLIDDPGKLVSGEPLARHGRGRLRRRFDRWRDRRAIAEDLIHGPNYFLPFFAETGVITVHDLSVLRFPETHPLERIKAFEREFEHSLARAAHVITDTETVRQEVIEQYGLSPDQVTAVLLGVSSSKRPMTATDLAPVLDRWGLRPGGYGLSISALEPRKKIAELLAAWRRLPRPLRDTYPLVLAGVPGWRNELLLQDIQAGIAEGWLKHLGFVEEALLPSLYAGAALFVYPSIYEGFGLPPLEAMACGVPTVVSSRSCLPEVCDSASRLVDPDDADDFMAAIEQGLTDEGWRAEAKARGLVRAGSLSWERCVKSTVDVYRQLGA